MYDFSFTELYAFILSAMSIIMAYRYSSELKKFIITVLDMILTRSKKRKEIEKHDETQKK